jgi:cell division topological specificity factor
MEWLLNLFRKPPSKDVAKDRLKLVLIHDRAGCSPDLLEMMKNDIVQVIAKYMDIGDNFDIHIETGVNEGHEPVPVLYANIPIKSMRKRG